MYPKSRPHPVFVRALFVSLLCGGLVLTGMTAAEEAKPAVRKPVETPQAAAKKAKPPLTLPPAKPAAPPGESAEETFVRAFRLKYADGRTVLEAVQSVVPEGTRAVFNERSNSILLAGPLAAFAQVEEVIELLDVPPTRDRADAGQLEVYQLRHIDAEKAVGALELLFGRPGMAEVRIDADPKNSRILVYGPLKVHVLVREALGRLDAPPDRDAGLQVKIFSLVHADAATVADTVSGLFKPGDVTISVDPRSNSLVAKGSEEGLMVIEAVLQRLDQSEGQEARRASSATFQVRVVWLVSGLEDQQPTHFAEDMIKVVIELQEAGIEDIRSVGQAVVRTVAGGGFEIDSLPVFGKNPSELRVSGQLEDRDGTPYLDIEISAKHLVCVPCDSDIAEGAEEPAPRRLEYERLVNLKTEITAPYGHYVVLGVTPVGKTTSVFVVQVTPSP